MPITILRVCLCVVLCTVQSVSVYTYCTYLRAADGITHTPRADSQLMKHVVGISSKGQLDPCHL